MQATMSYRQLQQPIEVQLCSPKRKEQKVTKDCPLKIFCSVQGLALQNELDSGNLVHLLKLSGQQNYARYSPCDKYTGEAIASIIADASGATSIQYVRGQTYDGAPNMSGSKKGVKQPLAKFVHCGAHCLNLITKKCCDASVRTINAIHWANEISVLLIKSIKAKSKFSHITESIAVDPVINVVSYSMGVQEVPQIKEILDSYHVVLQTLEELVSEGNQQFIYSGLLLGHKVTITLELLNKSFQGRQQTVSGLMKAADVATADIGECRTSSPREAERSFSSLRHLKTYLRNNMTQQQLNYVVICHAHLDNLNRCDLIGQ
ncbi:hypothetical protein PR048_007895, partial [Dryococelus australis]